MNPRLLVTIFITAAATVIVVLLVHSLDQSPTGMIEAPQKTVAEIPDMKDLAFTLPALPEPDLFRKPESICDGCAHNSCAPQPSIPEYPTVDLEGDCEVEFFLDEHGSPFDIVAQCSDEVFVRSAERAIAKMQWPVTDLNGETCRSISRGYRIRYPIQYRLQ